MKDTVSWLFFNQVDSIRIKGFGVTVNANVKETSVSAHKHSHTYTHTYIQKRRVLFQRSSFFFLKREGGVLKCSLRWLTHGFFRKRAFGVTAGRVNAQRQQHLCFARLSSPFLATANNNNPFGLRSRMVDST